MSHFPNLCCYQSVKDKKFESNSQLEPPSSTRDSCCYQSVKDKKFESNSQHYFHFIVSHYAVISLSKIKNLKAIHNYSLSLFETLRLLSVCQR